MNTPVLQVCDLGQRMYQPVFDAMRDYTVQRGEDSTDQFWLVEHPPVFTQGQAGKAEHLLNPGDIPVVKADRGGQVTYHGPGQLVMYTLVDLPRAGLNVRNLVGAIEITLKRILAELGVEARTRAGAPGVYVGERKIASLGLRVRKGRSYHGLALNIEPDLEPFRRINPCGYAGLEMTSLRQQLGPGGMPSRHTVERRLVVALCEELGIAAWDNGNWPYGDAGLEAVK